MGSNEGQVTGSWVGFREQCGEEEWQKVSVGEILKTLELLHCGWKLIFIFRGFRRRTECNVRFGYELNILSHKFDDNVHAHTHTHRASITRSFV